MKKSKEFQQLVELTDIITRYKIRQLDVITNPKSGEKEQSRYWQFYNAVAEGKFSNDRDAAAYFGLDENERKYKRLRKGLFDRLVNTIFFVDISEKTARPSDSAYYDCLKQYAAMRALYSRGARVAAAEMAKNLIIIGKKYDFCEIVAGSAQILKSFYAKSAKEQRKFEETFAMSLEYNEKHKNQILIQGIYNRIMMPYVNSKSVKKETIELIEKHLGTLDKIPEKHRSRNFMVFLFLIKAMKEITQNQWTEAIIKCNEALNYFDQRNIKVEQRTFYLQKSMAEVMLRKYTDAEASTEACLRLTNAGSGNWFKLQEVKMMLFFHSARYDAAFELNQKIKRHSRFESVSPADRETWLLFDAYLYLLDFLDQIENKAISPGKAKKFRISRLMNDVPIYSKDKRGMNIPLIILHFMFLLQEGEFDEADNRMEAIMKYYQRHLKAGDNNYRTNCFIKMMEAVIKSGFTVAGAAKKAQPWKEKLKSVPLNLLNQVHEIEIIPYETLWDMSLVSLGIGNQR